MNNYAFTQPPSQTPPDTMPDWQTCDTSMRDGAHNNHGMPKGGNGVGGAAATHKKHGDMVPPPIEGGN